VGPFRGARRLSGNVCHKKHKKHKLGWRKAAGYFDFGRWTERKARRSAATCGGIGCEGSRRQRSAVVLSVFAKFTHGSQPSM